MRLTYPSLPAYRTLIQPDLPSARTTRAQLPSHSTTISFVPPGITLSLLAPLEGDDRMTVLLTSRNALAFVAFVSGSVL